MKEDESIESKFFTKNIERMQERVERDNFESRKNLLEYDDVLNQQRTVIYTYRRMVLEGEAQIFELVRDLMVDAVHDMVAFYAPRRTLDAQGLQDLLKALSSMVNIPVEALQEKTLMALIQKN